VFNLAHKKDYHYVLVKDLSEKPNKPEEKVLVYNQKQIYGKPYSKAYVKDLLNFDKKMSN
jgi:hypothetical protein